MKIYKKILTIVGVSVFAGGVSAQTTVTIGTVNNGDMVRMQGLSNVFEKANPDIKLEWVVLEENVLRQRLSTDISIKGGEFDVMTIGMYEAPIWGGLNWLEPMVDLPASYDIDDVFPAIRNGLSHDGTLYALPFYGESSMTMYRKDLFDAAGITLADEPTWDDMYAAAKAIHKPDEGIYGACLRGKAGWGENVAIITTMANAHGAQWFDMDWKAQFDQPEWKNTLDFYVDLLTNYGPPDVANNGFNETLALMNEGHCGFWVDATVAGSFVTNPKNSKVADKMAFAAAPKAVTAKGSNWLWAWSLAVPVSSDAKDAAKMFVQWATSKEYIALVAEREGVANVPPGTRQSTYDNPAYIAEAPFATTTLSQIFKANPNDSTLNESPYTGIQLVAIPPFQAIATEVGKQFSATLTGTDVESALSRAQKSATRAMRQAGY
ncbi:sugar ABC transporter substrate-binding protein [Reinekea sp.]|uniref:ABC transporter substrate-binding protein n=1 Tax=Reinekea sp. TaxID=1970455 RepID=UPI002A7EE23C|nr:sugar ABC transporter substrate-binding protein [Reinekea sp.]